MTDKIQSSERPTNGSQNIQMQTEVFRAELTTPLHYEIEQEWPKVIRKPALVYPYKNESWMIGIPKTMQKLIGIL